MSNDGISPESGEFPDKGAELEAAIHAAEQEDGEYDSMSPVFPQPTYELESPHGDIIRDVVLSDAEEAMLRSSAISLAADNEYVRKAALALVAFERDETDPTTETDNQAAKRVMREEFGLDFEGAIEAKLLAAQRYMDEQAGQQ